MNFWLIASPVVGVLALLYAFYKAGVVSKAAPGNERMKEIAGYIEDGAMAFLSRQYKSLSIFVVGVFVVLAIFINVLTAICFLIGAAFSVAAGYVGMKVATKANVRTSNAAMEGGMNKALNIAFSGGAVMGMVVV